MTDYETFLASKRAIVEPSGFQTDAINPKLFPFQRDIVRWALELGKAALFESVGLGKTAQQLEWAHHVAEHTGKPVLVLTPLGVAAQTVKEGDKFGIDVRRVYEQADVKDALVVVTNYDRVHLFDTAQFGGVVLDEASILKHYSKTFFGMVERFKDTPFKLVATATPAPNDWVEIGNYAMFLDVMHFKDMLARWFVGEGDIARQARLKKHGEADFWRWLTSWAVCLTRPGDLGDAYEMPGYDLPPLHIHEHRLGVDRATIERAWKKGRLMADDSVSATQFMQVKRESLAQRVEKARELVEALDAHEPVILWCDTNFEADALKDAFPEAVEVRGSQSTDVKEAGLLAFTNGDSRMIITKPQLAGFGLNWQHCHQMIFAGVSFSFERTYQALGRVHRYGQQYPVEAHLIYAESEGNVMQALEDKRRAFAAMQSKMTDAIQEHGLFRHASNATVYSKPRHDVEQGDNWTFYLGDCVTTMREQMADESVDFSVHSPPFSSLYIYSDSEADMGNSATKEEFFTHYTYVITELLRITKPGRCAAVHVKDLPLFINRDGEMGIDPFSDEVTAAFRRAGWVLQSRITVEKDPVIEMQKTNSHGLLFKNWRERGEILRVGLPDYVLVFVKPGECVNPVRHDPADMTYFGDKPPAAWRYPTLPSRGTGEINAALPIWQEYANPNWSDVVVPAVWSDINQTDVLNYMIAKTNEDERHLCPLQLDLIARLIHWKSNPGDVVFDPFGGVASTPYKALELGRKGVAVELKPEYHALGVKYLKAMETKLAQPTLWQYAESINAAHG